MIKDELLNTILGRQAIDRMTKFSGAVSAVSVFLNGMIQAHVQPVGTADKMPDAMSIDVGQLDLTGDNGDFTFAQPAFALGDFVRDQISGIEGYVTMATYCMNGCVRVAVEGKVVAETGERKIHAFDHGRVARIDNGVAAAPPSVSKPGGPSERIRHEPALR